MPHVWSSPAIAAVPTPQAAEVCAHCGRCTSRTGHLDTQGTRACWTDSCTVSIEPHLRKALSADDRTPHMAFSRNGSFGNAIVAARRGEAALKKVERAACAGRLVLRQRVVAYAAIGYNMRALGWVNHALYACRPSLHVDGYRPFLVNDSQNSIF